jgi:hypothetical protein
MYSGEYDVCDVTLIYPVWIYTQSNITNIIYLLLKNSKRVLIPKAIRSPKCTHAGNFIFDLTGNLYFWKKMLHLEAVKMEDVPTALICMLQYSINVLENLPRLRSCSHRDRRHIDISSFCRNISSSVSTTHRYHTTLLPGRIKNSILLW